VLDENEEGRKEGRKEETLKGEIGETRGKQERKKRRNN
jgi:hypothetical protein